MKIKTLPLGELETNCYIASCDGEAAVIDPGADAELVLRMTEKEQSKIKYIILTHAHFDHMGAAAELAEKSGAKLVCSVTDSLALDDSAVNLSGNFMPELKTPKADIMVREGDEISFGTARLKVIETPGHTLGGICLYCEGTLFSGDTLFRRSVGRCDFPTGNGAALVNSVKEKLFVLPNDTVVYPGHGLPTTIGEEKRENPYVR